MSIRKNLEYSEGDVGAGKMSVHRFEALDAWRGICALLVALYHLSAAGYFFDFPIVRNGGAGVEFFFVLSGFVIAYAYRNGVSAPSFLLRRFGRLYPLHLFTLGVLVCIELAKLVALASLGVTAGSPAFQGDSSLPSLVANLLLANGLGFFDYYSWNGPSWSISTEFYTYLIYLAIVYSGNRWSVVNNVLIIGLSFCLLVANKLAGSPLSNIEGEGFILCVFGFFVGKLLYSGYAAAVSKNFIPPRHSELVALLVVIVIFMGWVPELAMVPLFAGVIFVFAFQQGVISKALTTRVPQHLGEISYSIYLVHFPVLALINGTARVAQQVLDTPLYSQIVYEQRDMLSFGGPLVMDGLALAYILVVVGVASLTYRFIEVPGRDVFRRLSAGKTKTAAA